MKVQILFEDLKTENRKNLYFEIVYLKTFLLEECMFAFTPQDLFM